MSDNLKVAFDSLIRLWASIIVSNNKQPSVSRDDAVYEEFRDELDDFAIIEDYN